MATFPQWNQKLHFKERKFSALVYSFPHSDLLQDEDGFEHGFAHLACHLVDAWESLTHCGVVRTDWLHHRLLQYNHRRYGNLKRWKYGKDSPRTKALRLMLPFGRKGFDGFLNEDNHHVLRSQQLTVVRNDEEVVSSIKDWRELAFLLRLKQRLEALQLEVYIGRTGDRAHWFLVHAPWLRGSSTWSKKDSLQAILCPIDDDLYPKDDNVEIGIETTTTRLQQWKRERQELKQ